MPPTEPWLRKPDLSPAASPATLKPVKVLGVVSGLVRTSGGETVWLSGNQEAQWEVRGINTFGRNEAMRLYVLAERTGSAGGGERWPTVNHLYLSLRDDIYTRKLSGEWESFSLDVKHRNGRGGFVCFRIGSATSCVRCCFFTWFCKTVQSYQLLTVSNKKACFFCLN